MRRFLLGLGLALAAWTPGGAQEAIPDRRLVITRDVDYYGADLQSVFDTTIEACQKICLDTPTCQAFTFNTRSNACFPKSEVTDRQPYEGAVSGRVVEVSEPLRSQAQDRSLDIGFIGENDLNTARTEAGLLARRHGGGQWTPEALIDAADGAYENGNFRDAIHWVGAALAQTDDPALWLRYGQWSGEYADSIEGADQRKYRQRAYLAAINAYLRASAPDHLMDALRDMAQSLEKNRRGRDMIPALRLAEFYGEREEITQMLNEAIGKYGFRIREHTVEADSADPRICVSFTEKLIKAGQDYTPYVRLPDPRMAVSADDQRICVTGVEHGGRYSMTFRSGLPAENGERLIRNVDITAYVRDRSPKIGFPGRAYVLPRSQDAGLPIETVNLDTVDLVLRRVSDRNLLRAMQESYFGNPLSRYDEQYVAQDIAEEIWRGTGQVENQLNTDMLTRLPMGDVIGELPAGIYALTAGIPGRDEYDENRTTQWFILSDIGLTSLQGNDGLTVFARGLADASPLAGLDVTLVSSANRELQTVTSDAQGVARFEPGLLRGAGGSRAALVVAKQGETDIAFLSLTDPGFDLSDRGVAGREPAGPIDTFLTTDRGAYRVGEVIHATALLRDAKVAALPDLALTAVLNRPDGVEYARYVSDGGLDGGHVFSMPLAPTSPRGTWRLEIYSDPEADPLVSNTVLVEDFVPERIDFDLILPGRAINPLDPPQLEVEARYLFGAVGADLPIEGELVVTSQSELEGFPKYQFGRHDEESYYRTNSFDADVVTSSDGKAALRLPLPDLSEVSQPLQARAVLRLSEGSGRPVERSIARTVSPAAPIIGIRPLFDDTLPEGAEAQFDVIAVGPDLTQQTMEVVWQVNRVRTRYQWYQQYGSWNWEPITTRTTVAKGTGLLGADPLRIAADVEWGAYEIVVERTDGAYLASSMQFDAGWYAPADAADTPDMLDLSLNKPAYGPGDTATLRMVPRYAGKALVTVLSDRVVSMQAIDVVEGENTLDLPVTEDWGAGVYVTAQVIRPMDVAAGQNPARALGLAHAAVDPGARKLSVSFDVENEVAPRGPLTAAVQIDGLSGQTAHVTVAAVDVGILNLTGFQSPDPTGHFFGQRRLGVEIRDIYGRLIDGSNGAMGAVRSGGDAAAGMSLQSPPPTEDLVAFFSGPVTVDANGRAEVEFPLPDFNGAVRLMAVAWSPTAVGQAEADVLVRDPVVLSAALPRFLAPGDRSRLLLDLTHVKGPAGEMPLEITAQGLDLAGPAPVAVVLDEGTKRSIEVPIVADQEGDHTLRIALTLPSGQALTKELTLGVRANDPDIGTTRRLSLAGGETFTLDRNVFAGLREGDASALVSAGPLARFDAPGLLASLDRYPYGCTEQVTSQAMPLLYMSAIAEPLGLGNKGKIDLRVQQSITKILTRQAPSGGFGLWRAYAGDFWLDAYVTDFLGRARAAGYEVPALAWRNAIDNLRNRIAYAPDFDQGGEDIAYALMVLAREGEAAMGDLRYYADERATAFSTTLARAQLGAALASYGDQPRADRMFASAQSHLPTNIWDKSRSYRMDYGSYMRDTAGLLSLAVEARSEAVDRDALTRRIGAANRPLSTQEQAWALLAAHAMVQDPTVSGLALDGTPQAGPFVRRYQARGLDPVQITNTGSSPTDLTLTTLGKPEGDVEATGYGYQISREYYRMDGRALEGDIRVGDRLVAVITVRPGDKTRARLMVNDPLPAGFEIDNPNLLRSGDLRALDWLDPSSTENAEFRSDRFLAAVDQSGDRRIQLAYILRAVSPGEFHHPAALVEDMYRPDYRATTASGRVTIQP